MALTADQSKKLNGMCKGAQIAELGTELTRVGNMVDQGTVYKDTYTVTADDQTAGTFNTGDINTILLSGLITGFIVQIYRAGKLVTGQAVSTDGASLTVATNGSTYVLTTGDVINYIIF